MYIFRFKGKERKPSVILKRGFWYEILKISCETHFPCSQRDVTMVGNNFWFFPNFILLILVQTMIACCGDMCNRAAMLAQKIGCVCVKEWESIKPGLILSWKCKRITWLVALSWIVLNGGCLVIGCMHQEVFDYSDVNLAITVVFL